MHVARSRTSRERVLRVPQRHRRRDVADLLAGVGVADHHLELAPSSVRSTGFASMPLAISLGAIEILELLEQRHRAQLARRETGGAREEHDLEQVRDLAREADVT